MVIKVSIGAGILIFLANVAIAAEMDAPIFGTSAASPQDPPAYAMQTASDEHVSGYVEGRFTHAEAADFDIGGNNWSIRGSINFDTGRAINLQLDGGYSRSYSEGINSDLFGGMIHAYMRPDERYAVGAFFGISKADNDLLQTLGFDEVNDYIGGIEGAFFTDTASFYGRAGYGRVSMSKPDLAGDHYLGMVGARYYATENLRFDLEGAINRFAGYGGHIDDYALIATANYRPEGLPATIFAGYRFDQFRIEDSAASLGHMNMNSLFAGLRFSFGSTSLKDEERNGPVWTDANWLQQ